MSGICTVVANDRARDIADAITERMTAPTEQSATIGLTETIALGRTWRGRLESERAPRTENGIAVIVEGEIFDDNGPMEDPCAVVMNHYQRNSLDRLAWLNGDFSAIIADPANRRMVLATDRMGSRPFFYWWRDGELAAATRLDALLADDRVPRRVSLRGIIELLSWQRTVADHTQYADICSLPGSSLLIFEDGRIRQERTRRLTWGSPDFTEREAGELLATALTRAAGRRLSDTVRHGLLLSGGLDSRLVLAAARAAGKTVSCVTAATHNNFEVKVAQACAKRAKMPFEYVPNPPDALADRLDPATVASHGTFAAPINLFGLWPDLAGRYDVLLSGH